MATYARNPLYLDLPRPGRAALPFALLALAALGFEADRRLPWIVGVLAAGVLRRCGSAARLPGAAASSSPSGGASTG